MKIKISEELFNNIQEATHMASGTMSNVYLNRIGNRVFKTPLPNDDENLRDMRKINRRYSDREIRQFQLMQKYPQFFLKIEKITPTYLVSERLHGTSEITSKIDDLFYLQQYDENDLMVAVWSYGLKSVLEKPTFKEFFHVNEHDENLSLFMDILRYVDKLRSSSFRKEYVAATGSNVVDFWTMNFGYDSSGQLKMLDI